MIAMVPATSQPSTTARLVGGDGGNSSSSRRGSGGGGGGGKVLAGCVVAALDSAHQRKAVTLGAKPGKLGDSGVTHVITKKALSTPHGVQVRPEWLRALARGVDADEATEQHKIAILAGLELVASGVKNREKDQLEKLATDNGATFTRGLARSCTHLLTPVCKGAKYDFVIDRGVKCFVVTPQWLRDSVEAGRPCDEHNYRPRKSDTPADNPSATPAPPDSGKPPRAQLQPPRSALKSKSKRKSPAKSPARSSKSKQVDMEPEIKPVEETPPPPSNNAIPNPNGTEEPAASFSNHHVQDPQPAEPVNNAAPTEAKPAQPQTSLKLNARVIYLTRTPAWNKQAHTAAKRQVHRLASTAGFTIADRMSHKVNTTAILSIPVAPADVQVIRKATSERRVDVVGVEWIEQCIEQNQVLPVSDVPPPQWETNPKKNTSTVVQGASLIKSITDAPINIEPTSKIFLGTRVTLGPLALRDPGSITNLTKVLREGSAKILPHNPDDGFCTNGVPTHAVCPPSLKPAEQAVVEALRNQTKNRLFLVTNEWITTCLQENELISPTDCALFKPVPRNDEPNMLKCNVAISGFMKKDTDRNRRRETLQTLVRLLGGKYHDRLNKKTTAVLIADPTIVESTKIKKAKEWNIPVVSHKWLLAIAASGNFANFANHPLIPEPQLPSKRKIGSTISDNPSSATGTGSTQSRRPKPPLPPPPSLLTQQNATQTPMPDVKSIAIFGRFTSALNSAKNEDDDDVPHEENVNQRDQHMVDDTLNPRSNSVSLDAREWSDSANTVGSASQSQVIVHRDLTPPPSPAPNRRSRRSLPQRESKAKRIKLGP